eukprot:snap_masked-scaffold_3-processed-gene-5.33-mRNA-1 protein AED:1.00 eAED:1.00 QI:0/0/0/0/1/1/4/0/457
MKKNETIEENQWVVIKFDTERLYLFKVSDSVYLHVGEYRCPLISLVGETYGSVFSPTLDSRKVKNVEFHSFDKNKKVSGIKKKKIKRLNKLLPGKLVKVETKSKQTNKSLDQSSKDNRNIFDTNKSQNLDMKDIETLKKQAAEMGNYEVNSLINQIAENNATFKEKTVHAQEKYLNTKFKKHSDEIRILKPNMQLIASCLWKKTKLPGAELNGMRGEDSLPQMLNYANVCAGSNVLVLDSTNGFLLGCILERLGGFGQVFSMFVGSTPPINYILQYFNLSKVEQKILKYCDMNKFLKGEKGDEQIQSIDAADERRKGYLEQHKEKGDTHFEAKLQDYENWKAKKAADVLFYKQQRKIFDFLRNEKADCLVVSSKFSPKLIMANFLDYVTPGGKFCLYSEHLEDLVSIKFDLQKNTKAINVRVVENFLRQYQISKGRTHPHMKMSGTGGFILYGAKVE